MPIAGGILVAEKTACCLSSAAGMFRFLARLSGRRRHNRRNCGAGGCRCVSDTRIQSEDPRTSRMTTISTATTTTSASTSSIEVSIPSEISTGCTTTLTSIHQDRRKDCCDESIINRIEDSSWMVKNHYQSSTRNTEEPDERLHAQADRTSDERTRNFTSCKEDESSSFHSRLNGDEDHNEIRQNNERLSINDCEDLKIHRVEEIPQNKRLTRGQRLHKISKCRSNSTTTEITNNSQEEWRTRHEYVDLLEPRQHHFDNRERDTMEQQKNYSRNSFCFSTTRRNKIPPYLATLLILSYTLFGIADACSSRSTPKPRPPTVTSRPNITFHMYTCPPDYAEWYCLNGATCFTINIQDSLLYNCICSDGFIGQRCEYKDLDGSYLPSRQRVMLETASIAGGATIAVFLVVIICIAAYIHCKRKQKELRTSSTCVDTVDGPGRDPELRPFSNRSLMIFMAKNHPNGSTMCPSIEQTRMPGWNDYSQIESTRMASVNEGKRGSSQ